VNTTTRRCEENLRTEAAAGDRFPRCVCARVPLVYKPSVNEQSLVCLSNREVVEASRRRPFHFKVANNRLITVIFSTGVGLIYVSIQPPSIITAFAFPPSTLAVEFCYSDTRACSCQHNNPDSLDERLFLSVVAAVAPALTMDEASSLSPALSNAKRNLEDKLSLCSCSRGGLKVLCAPK